MENLLGGSSVMSSRRDSGPLKDRKGWSEKTDNSESPVETGPPLARKIIIPPKMVDSNKITVIKMAGSVGRTKQRKRFGGERGETGNYYRNPELQQGDRGWGPARESESEQDHLGSSLPTNKLGRKEEMMMAWKSRIKTLVATPSSNHPDIAIVNSISPEDSQTDLSEIFDLENLEIKSNQTRKSLQVYLKDHREQLEKGAEPFSGEGDSSERETTEGDLDFYRALNDESNSPTEETQTLSEKPDQVTRDLKKRSQKKFKPGPIFNQDYIQRYRVPPSKVSFVNPLEELQKSLYLVMKDDQFMQDFLKKGEE